MLYPPDACTSPAPASRIRCSWPRPMPSRVRTRDEVKAIWFYARAWDFAPPAYKAQIEPQLDYWYKRYHGTLDGDAAIKQQIDAIKTQAQATLFPPAGFTIAPAPTPAELGSSRLYQRRSQGLSLEDKEYILANGSDADATGLWALLKGQADSGSGHRHRRSRNGLEGHRDHDRLGQAQGIRRQAHQSRRLQRGSRRRPPSSRSKDAQAYILANGVKADTDAMATH